MINDELDNEDMPVGRDLGPTDDNTIAVGNITSSSGEERGGNAAGEMRWMLVARWMIACESNEQQSYNRSTEYT